MLQFYQLMVYINIENLVKTINYKDSFIHLLQHAVGVKSYEQYKKYSAGIHNLTPINLRDLLEFKKKNNPVNIDEVEPVTEIMKRFGSGSMSHGALSEEAHETLAIGMNRIGLPVVVKEVRTLEDLKYLKMVTQQILKLNKLHLQDLG